MSYVVIKIKIVYYLRCRRVLPCASHINSSKIQKTETFFCRQCTYAVLFIELEHTSTLLTLRSARWLVSVTPKKGVGNAFGMCINTQSYKRLDKLVTENTPLVFETWLICSTHAISRYFVYVQTYT